MDDGAAEAGGTPSNMEKIRPETYCLDPLFPAEGLRLFRDRENRGGGGLRRMRLGIRRIGVIQHRDQRGKEQTVARLRMRHAGRVERIGVESHLETVRPCVAVGVNIEGIGAGHDLLRIRQSILIRVSVGIGNQELLMYFQ